MRAVNVRISEFVEEQYLHSTVLSAEVWHSYCITNFILKSVSLFSCVVQIFGKNKWGILESFFHPEINRKDSILCRDTISNICFYLQDGFEY